MENNWIESVEKVIDYTFINKSLLIQAFTHSSYTNEHKNFADYERLEYIGDATLGYVMAVYLYNLYPNMREGELTKKRAGLVDEVTLSKLVDKMRISKHLLVGVGNTKDQINNSVAVKCDLFEAVIGAILLDSNMEIENAKKFILKYLENMVSTEVIDYKSKLLEECAKKKQVVEFRLLETDENDFGFKTGLFIDGVQICIGIGNNKKTAEKKASQNYFSKNRI